MNATAQTNKLLSRRLRGLDGGTRKRTRENAAGHAAAGRSVTTRTHAIAFSLEHTPAGHAEKARRAAPSPHARTRSRNSYCFAARAARIFTRLDPTRYASQRTTAPLSPRPSASSRLHPRTSAAARTRPSLQRRTGPQLQLVRSSRFSSRHRATGRAIVPEPPRFFTSTGSHRQLS